MKKIYDDIVAIRDVWSLAVDGDEDGTKSHTFNTEEEYNAHLASIIKNAMGEDYAPDTDDDHSESGRIYDLLEAGDVEEAFSEFQDSAYVPHLTTYDYGSSHKVYVHRSDLPKYLRDDVTPPHLRLAYLLTADVKAYVKAKGLRLKESTIYDGIVKASSTYFSYDVCIRGAFKKLFARDYNPKEDKGIALKAREAVNLAGVRETLAERDMYHCDLPW